MKFVDNWYMPDTEKYFVKHSVNNYQKNKRDYAVKLCKHKRNVIDIGANIGIWAKDFCETFNHVYCFEPVTTTVECLHKNLEQYDNKTIYNIGLGDIEEIKSIQVNSSGCGHSSITEVWPENSNVRIEEINIHTLDSYNLTDINLIKMDIQGYEYNALLGAKQTLLDNNPILCLEYPARDKRENNLLKKSDEFLTSINYKFIKRMANDVYYRKQ